MDKREGFQEEQELLLLTSKEGQRESSSGTQSIKLDCLGELKEISDHCMIPVAKLVNLGADVVRVALFEDNVISEAYMRIKKRANLHNNQEIELYLIKNAIEILGTMLIEDRKTPSTYSRIIHLLKELKEHGKVMSLPEMIEKAVKRGLDDSKFVKELLNS